MHKYIYMFVVWNLYLISLPVALFMAVVVVVVVVVVRVFIQYYVLARSHSYLFVCVLKVWQCVI